MPETPTIVCASAPAAALQRSPSKLGAGLSSNTQLDLLGQGNTKTTKEKQALLGRYLSNVDDLVEDLRASAPFEGSF